MKFNVVSLFLSLFLFSVSCTKNNNQPANPVSGPAGTWVSTHFPVTTQSGISTMLATKGGRILVGTAILYGNPSLYYSTDTGATWHASDSLNPARVNGTPFAIKQNPNTNRIFIGCNGQQLNSLFTSTDDGATWINNPNTFVPVDFAFMNNKTYMTLSNGVSPSARDYLMSSTDEFLSNWTSCTPNTAFAPYTLFADNGVLFTGSISTNALYRSSNPESKTYTLTDNGITWATLGTSWVKRMIREDSYLFAASSEGIFRSADNGANWTACNLGFAASANDFAIVGTDLYVALADSAVYKSSDRGATWSSFHNGLTVPLTVKCLQVTGDYLLEGDATSQVYRLKLQ